VGGGRISELAWLIDKLSVVFADMQSHQCTHCRKQFAHRGNLMRHLALHDPNNAEYQAALRRDDAASTGDEADYEAGDDEGTTFLELHNAVAAASDAGVQLTELDGDQMQVFCVLRFIKVKLFRLLCVCAILPGKAVPEMTYTVSGGMLNPTLSIVHSECYVQSQE